MSKNPPSQPRDLRIDMLRGLALLAIFINHIPTNPARYLTWGWLGFSDAAEVFMLLAGVSLAIGYANYQAKHGWVSLAARLASRSFRLYRTYLLLAMALAAGGAFAFALTDNRAVLWHLGIAPLIDNTVAALPAMFTLSYLPGYADILATYVPLVLFSAFLLPLAGRHPALVLVPSLLLWLMVQVTGRNLPSGFDGQGWMFNPLAWQLLFCIGMTFGLGARRGWSWPRHRVLDAAAILWVLAGIVATAPWRHLGITLGFPMEGEMPLGAKNDLAWQRLLHILALAHLVQRFVPHDAAWLRQPWLVPLTLMGRQPLPVFAAGAILSFVGYCALVLWPDPSWARVLLVNVGGASLLMALALLKEWRAGNLSQPVALRQGLWLPVSLQPARRDSALS